MKVILAKTLESAEKCFDLILNSKHKYLGADTEATGLDPHTSKITLVQLSIEGTVYLFFASKIEHFFSAFTWFLDKCKGRKIFIFHNFKYDLKMFWKHGVDFTGQLVFDTMLAAKVLECGLTTSVSLLDVMQRYVGVTLDKTEQRSDWSVDTFSNEQLKYAAKDVYHLEHLTKTLTNELKENNLVEVFKLEMRCVYGFAAMEYYGVKLDVNRLNKLKPFYLNICETATQEFLKYVPVRYELCNLIGELLDTGVKITSNNQVLEILQELKIPNPVYDPNSRYDKEKEPIISSTGTPVLSMLDTIDYPIIDSLLKFRKANKVLTSYIENMPASINPITGRLHTNFNQILTTGRASSSEPGLNQLPRPTGKEPLDDNGKPLTIRSCFVAEEGYKFALADMSQIELRVLASVCKDENMLAEFREKKDPYASTAALINDLNYNDLVYKSDSGEDKVKPEYKKLRQGAKAPRLGLNYGMGYKKYRNYAHQQYGIIMSLDEAYDIRAKYFSVYPKLAEYHDSFKDKSIRSVYTLPPFNRRRLFDDYYGITALANLPIQGTSGDIQKLAIATIYEELHSKGFSPTQSHGIKQVLTVYDELELEAEEKYAEYARQMLEKHMVSAGEFVIKDCPIIAEAALVDNLSEKE